jgi:ABC-type Mn2+/Zn2+ transport system permease subunit
MRRKTARRANSSLPISDPLDLFANPFYQRALAAALLIGFANGFFSGFVVLRRNALSVSALSHTMLPGIAFGILITGALTQASAFVGALFAALMVGLGSVAIARGNRIAQGTALAVIYTSAFAAGVAILPRLDTRQELEHWLFGDIMAVGNSDLWIAFATGAFTLVMANLLMRPLLLTLFEPNVAAAQGVPVRSMHYLQFTLLILALVSSLQAVGCVLSVGMLIAPAATVSLLTDKTSALFWGGGIIGGGGAVAGVLLAASLGLAPGPVIVMLLGVLFLAAWVFSPKYGVLALRRG